MVILKRSLFMVYKSFSVSKMVVRLSVAPHRSQKK